MNHSFNIEIATKYGVREAIFIENLAFWIFKNQANDVNFNDGYYWSYNTVKAFETIFPYWSFNKIRRIIDNLESKNILKSGNYNTDTRNRTKWYTIIDIEILQIYRMHLSETTNGNGENHKSSITDNKHTDINNNEDQRSSKEKESLKPKNKDTLYQEIIDYFFKKNKSGMKDYQRQGRSVKNIIKRAKIYYPDFEPRDSLRTIIAKFWELHNSTNKFWNTQPFLPSTVDSLRIWDTIIELVKKPNQKKQEIDDMIDKVLEAY